MDAEANAKNARSKTRWTLKTFCSAEHYQDYIREQKPRKWQDDLPDLRESDPGTPH